MGRSSAVLTHCFVYAWLLRCLLVSASTENKTAPPPNASLRQLPQPLTNSQTDLESTSLNEDLAEIGATTARAAPLCNGTLTPAIGTGVTGTSCAEYLYEGSACSVQCESSMQAVGIFYCSQSGLLGSPSCQSPSTPTQDVTRFVGTFAMTVQLTRAPGLGLAFKTATQKALAETLVILATDFRRLEVELLSHLDAGEEKVSVIQVVFELVVRTAYWDEQISEDLDNFGSSDSDVHKEFVDHMTQQGYPVIHIDAATSPISFSDTVVFQEVDPAALRRPFSILATALGGTAVGVFLCITVCLIRLGFRRKRGKDPLEGMPKIPHTRSPTVRLPTPPSPMFVRGVSPLSRDRARMPTPPSPSSSRTSMMDFARSSSLRGSPKQTQEDKEARADAVIAIMSVREETREEVILSVQEEVVGVGEGSLSNSRLNEAQARCRLPTGVSLESESREAVFAAIMSEGDKDFAAI